ncbi:MAG: bifunctional heptose 7-phosphate kinase/heptose 1-phosphate adenyltransferase [Armatimonadota bacterium]
METYAQTLSRARLQALLAGMRAVRIGVVGDAALDVYWDADMTLSGLARENPHHFLPVVRERLAPGGGCHAAACAAALGARTGQLALLGDDWRGRELARLLPEENVNPDFLLASPERTTNAFCKPLRYGLCEVVYEDPHLYFENRTPTPPAVERELLERLETLLAQVDAVLVADYHEHGTMTGPLRERICAAGKAGTRVLVDSRTRINEYHNVMLKPNEVEAARAAGLDINPREVSREQLEKIAVQLAEQNSATVCLTLGAEGCLWAEGGIIRHIPTRPAPPPIDIVGAGDAFAAACLTALAAGADEIEAAAIGHLAAGVVVRKIGVTGTATPDEILQRFDEDLLL